MSGEKDAAVYEKIGELTGAVSALQSTVEEAANATRDHADAMNEFAVKQAVVNQQLLSAVNGNATRLDNGQERFNVLEGKMDSMVGWRNWAMGGLSVISVIATWLGWPWIKSKLGG